MGCFLKSQCAVHRCFGLLFVGDHYALYIVVSIN